MQRKLSLFTLLLVSSAAGCANDDLAAPSDADEVFEAEAAPENPSERPTIRWITSARDDLETMTGTRVFPVAMHNDDTSISLELRLLEYPERIEFERAAITNTFDPDIAPRTGIEIGTTQSVNYADWEIEKKGGSNQLYTLKTNARNLLNALQTDVNTNAITGRFVFHVWYSAAPGPIKVVVKTPGVLHLISQRAIIMLPGIVGSALWIPPAQGGANRAARYLPSWPNPLRVDDLAVTPTGEPERQAMWVTPLSPWPLLRYALGAWGDFPYDAHAMSEMAEEAEPGMLKLRRPTTRLYGMLHSSTQLFHLPVFPYPYDWRLTNEAVADGLFSGHDDPADPAYDTRYMFQSKYMNAPSLNRPWSLRALIRGLQGTPEFEFAEAEVDVVGHSKGGSVADSVARRPEAVGVVHSVSTVNAPFHGSFGALSWLLYLHDAHESMSRHMWSRLVQRRVNEAAASVVTSLSNSPVFYALLPWNDTTLGGRRQLFEDTSRGQVEPQPSTELDTQMLVEAFVEYYRQANPASPIGRFTWNPLVAARARASARRLASQEVAVDRYQVFYSTEQANSPNGRLSTGGMLTYDGRRPPQLRPVEGDGTVDLISLRGEGIRGIQENCAEVPPAAGPPRTGHVSVLRNPNLWRMIVGNIRRIVR